MTRRCIAVLGGSFDPIHCAHVALVRLVAHTLQPDEIRIIPAGNPWQKDGLQASGEDRMAMAKLAFEDEAFAVTVDDQEIRRLCDRTGEFPGLCVLVAHEGDGPVPGRLNS